jgi:hypothetical protein
MDGKRRGELAATLIGNPLWELMKTELPQHYYNHFRGAVDVKERERMAMAHDIFDDAVAYIEEQAQMGAMIPIPETETGDGDDT